MNDNEYTLRCEEAEEAILETGDKYQDVISKITIEPKKFKAKNSKEALIATNQMKQGDVLIWDERKEPKFPKVFKNYAYIITVNEDHINIENKYEGNCGFGRGGSLELLKQAIAYQEANKDVGE